MPLFQNESTCKIFKLNEYVGGKHISIRIVNRQKVTRKWLITLRASVKNRTTSNSKL